MLPVEAPFKAYTDRTGRPLDGGYVYIGQPDQNPVTAPMPVFWDAAGTIPAAQPLRTLNGFISRAGSPANVFVEGDYSTLVQNRAREQVAYAKNSDEFSISSSVATLRESFSGVGGAHGIGFKALGGIDSNLESKVRETRNIEEFGAVSGAADNAPKIQAAIDYLKSIGGGQLVIPDKSFNTSRVVLDGCARIKIIGQGTNAHLQFIGTNADLITIKNSIFITIESVRLESDHVPTSGSMISIDNCAWIYLDRLDIGYYSRIYRGITITNVLGGVQGVYVSRCTILRHQAEAVFISATNSEAVINDIYYRDIWTQWVAGPGYPLAPAECIGFRFLRTAGALQAINLANCTGSAQGFAFSAFGVRFMAVTDGYFDGYTFIEKCDLGTVKGCWFSGGGDGSGTQLNAHEVRGGNALSFSDCIYIPAGVLSSSGSTIALQPSGNTQPTNITWDKCTIAGAGYRGMALLGGNHITLRNLTIGNNGGLYPNLNNITIGLDIQNTMSGRLTIEGGNYSDIASPIINNHGDKRNVRIANVAGFNPVKTVVPPLVPSSGSAYENAYGFKVRVWVIGGTGVTVYVNGRPIAFGPTMVTLAPGETIALIYTTAPTWEFQGE